uniref:topoisomerase DNA-binding C4 zinc finger domain-containing protein n=1 Tax=Ralstonia chuxiongensis TaxID=2957504 RepID=UPI003742B7F1
MPVSAATTCPKCKTGHLRLRKSDKGPFWGCSNWQAEAKCDARFPDANGMPKVQSAPKSRGFGFKRAM